MNNQDVSNHNLANGLGGQPDPGADLPGFLAGKLGQVTEQAAPDSYADIQARLAASRRRRFGLWLWSTGALVLGGLLLGLLWQNTRPTSSPATLALKESKPSQPKAPKKRHSDSDQASDPAATTSDPNLGPDVLEPADQHGSVATTSHTLSKPAHVSQTPASVSQKQASMLPATNSQDVAPSAVASNRPQNSLKARTLNGVSIGNPSGSVSGNASLGNETLEPQGSNYGTAPKDVVSPSSVGSPISTSLATTSAGADAKAAQAPALPLSSPPTLPPASAEPRPLSTEAPSTAARSGSMPAANPTSTLSTTVDSTRLATGAPEPVPALQPVAAKELSATIADSGLAAPAGVSPTGATHNHKRWQYAFGVGAGIFNRQVLVPKSQQKDFEPTGLSGGLALSLHGSTMYRIASSLYADFSLGLLYGQAVLSQLRYNTGSGISYQAVGNGFAGTPLAPAKTENTNLAYTLARVQAGIAWQPSLRWFATIKGGVQQTVLQKASYDGMPLPAYSFPVGASLKLRLYGPIWAGAEVTYFGSGAGQANTATLFVLEYRR